ncbi:hypothetical protein ACFL2T_06640 [Elusimicrobiota bacterium]
MSARSLAVIAMFAVSVAWPVRQGHAASRVRDKLAVPALPAARPVAPVGTLPGQARSGDVPGESAQEPGEEKPKYSKRVAFIPYASTVIDPFPCAGGANIGVTFYDTFRMSAGFGLVKFIALGVTGMTIAGYGASARLQYPGLEMTPVAGFGVSQLTIRGSPFREFGNWRENVNFYYPFVGGEWRHNDHAFFGFGMAFPWSRDNGATRGVWPRVYPYAQMGIAI